jgi:hypothetical protein
LEDRIRRRMNNKKKEAKKLQQVLVCIHKSKKKEKKRKNSRGRQRENLEDLLMDRNIRNTKENSVKKYSKKEINLRKKR